MKSPLVTTLWDVLLFGYPNRQPSLQRTFMPSRILDCISSMSKAQIGDAPALWILFKSTFLQGTLDEKSRTAANGGRSPKRENSIFSIGKRWLEKKIQDWILTYRLMDASYSCLALHGGLDQYDRDSVISDFRMGVCTLLIATSVAARGLDVRSLYLVVNYDCPSHYEDYVHRCGLELVTVFYKKQHRYSITCFWYAHGSYVIHFSCITYPDNSFSD